MIEVIEPIKESLDYMLEQYQQKTKMLYSANLEIDRLNALLDKNNISRTKNEINESLENNGFYIGEDVTVKCTGKITNERGESFEDPYNEIHTIAGFYGEWVRFNCVFELNGLITKVRHISGIRKVTD
tara:strand:- start:597 stop:980 length:384 start_codon:yes stop_codon:yes gene_type:complete